MTFFNTLLLKLWFFSPPPPQISWDDFFFPLKKTPKKTLLHSYEAQTLFFSQKVSIFIILQVMSWKENQDSIILIRFFFFFNDNIHAYAEMRSLRLSLGQPCFLVFTLPSCCSILLLQRFQCNTSHVPPALSRQSVRASFPPSTHRSLWSRWRLALHI